jgi:hypothetical protein
MKKAWEREYEMMSSAFPKVLEEDEQGWLFSLKVEEMDDIFLRMKWSSNVPGSNAPERVIIAAIQDMNNMGYDVSEAEALIDEGQKYLADNDMVSLNRVTVRIWNIMNNAKKINSHPYWQYKIYDTVEKYLKDIRHMQPVAVDKDSSEFREKTYYGWLAQICAGALGTAVEGYTTENIEKAFGNVTSYVRKPNTYNDDITYEIALLKAIERKGKDLTSGDIAEEWVALVPFGWSAEEWALKNIHLGIYPPESGYLHNPYREWIGAQMRGAVCGMIAPGDPVKAAKLAFMDGVVSHYNNGVLGEIFNAVLTSLAYVKTDIKGIVRDAICMIPKQSEYYSVVDFALCACLNEDNWKDAWKQCEARYHHYNWIHAYPNAAAEVVALWFGEGDFDKTMNIICMEGYDVDCNAAQIATPLGIINGQKTLSKQWTAPIGDELLTYVRANKKLSIRQLAEYTVQCSKKF